MWKGGGNIKIELQEIGQEQIC